MFDMNNSISLTPILNVPHDQYSYINLILPNILKTLESHNTLWMIPGGSLDLILAIYNSRPDILEWLNIYIVEVDKELYKLYTMLRENTNIFLQEVRNVNNNKRIKLNNLSIYKLHLLLNKRNIHLELSEVSIDKFLTYSTTYGDNDFVVINTSTRSNGEEFKSDLLLNIAYERLVFGLPTFLLGCNSNVLNRELEGSSTEMQELYVDRYVGNYKNRGLLTIYMYM